MVKRKQSILAPVVAIVLSGAVGMLVFSTMNSEETKAVIKHKTVEKKVFKPAPSVKVLAAKQNIMVGTKITAEHFMWRSWPESLISDNYILKDHDSEVIKNLHNGIVKIPMIQGEPIIANKIIPSGDRGALSVLLRKGMRAISVPITVVNSAGGFILPGDYVDILYTSNMIRDNFFNVRLNTNNQQVKRPILENYIDLKKKYQKRLKREDQANLNKKKSSSKNKNTNTVIKTLGKNVEDIDQKSQKLNTQLQDVLSKEKELLVANNSRFTEVLLENVRILAIDQSITQSISSSSSGRGRNQNAQNAQNTQTMIGASATVEVTPEQAKLLAWSVASGQLTLVLRSVDHAKKLQGDSVPVTKTSFAWPLDEVLGGALRQNPDDSSDDYSNQLKIMRNGRISFIRPSTNFKRKSKDGEVDVLR